MHLDLVFSGGVHVGFLFVMCLPVPSIKDTQYSTSGSSAQSGRLRPHSRVMASTFRRSLTCGLHLGADQASAVRHGGDTQLRHFVYPMSGFVRPMSGVTPGMHALVMILLQAVG